MLNVPGHGRPRGPRGVVPERLEHFSVILHRGSWPALDRGVEPGRHVAQRHAEKPGELARAGEQVHRPVKQEIELLELVVVAVLGGRLKIGVQPLEPGNRFSVTVPDGPGGELTGEKGLADKDIPDVIAGKWHDDKAAAGLKPHQALRAQLQQAFAHGSGADTQVLRNHLDADEIPAVQSARDNQIAYVRCCLGAQLRTVAAIFPRPVRRLLGRLREGLSVPGDCLSTALRRPADYLSHEGTGNEPLRTGMGGCRSSSSG